MLKDNSIVINHIPSHSKIALNRITRTLPTNSFPQIYNEQWLCFELYLFFCMFAVWPEIPFIWIQFIAHCLLFNSVFCGFFAEAPLVVHTCTLTETKKFSHFISNARSNREFRSGKKNQLEYYEPWRICFQFHFQFIKSQGTLSVCRSYCSLLLW